ncbi:MAG: pyridoxal phosphate-dependent aminotransferase [Bacteroidales bacterium]|nr:pyridoxal phosphate-dependent aminotransferase [Bacteroidales bacterium]
MSVLSERIRNLTASATLEMARISRELRAQGVNVIDLSIGEPDFNTPECVKEAAKKAIDDNHTHYTPVSGLAELRKAIAAKLKNENGLDYDPVQIVVSNGAKQSIANTMLCLVNPGEEVIIPAPYWVSYTEIAKLAGAVVKELFASIDNDFKVTPDELEEAITPKTKIFIFSSPCNPTGSFYTRKELEGLAGVFEKHPNVYIISDEIYEYINFTGKHESMAQFEAIRDRVITINGVSKGYAMTGWRIGYLAATKEIAKACDTLQGQITSGACSISQYASLTAFNGISCTSREVRTMVDEFRKRRDAIIDRLSTIPGIRTNVPAGAFYIFPNIASYFGTRNGKYHISDDRDLSMYLLGEAHVSVVPGSAFGNGNCIRISYATSMENLTEAMDRISEALSALKQ